MKKVVLILIVFLSLPLGLCLAQDKVWEMALTEALIIKDKQQKKQTRILSLNETSILGQIEAVKSQTKEIEGMQSEMFQSLCNFIDIAMSLTTIPFQMKEAEQILEDIYKAQMKVHKNILKCPNIEVLDYVSKEEKKIVDKAKELVKKLGPETIKDLLPLPGNFQNSRDIVKRFEYILSELRKIRTLSFALMRMTNIFNDAIFVSNLNFSAIQFQVQKEQIAKQIIDEQFKYIKK